MNRSHNVAEAKKCIETAKMYFDNLSVDLIYGTPGLSDSEWIENLNTLLQLNIPHISCYALTVEPKTALKKQIENGTTPQVDDEQSAQQYKILTSKLSEEGFVNYEFSNFGKPNYYSRNNTNYWSGKKYIGVGPSAHSFDGNKRSWNIANNSLYIKGIQNKTRHFEEETLSTNDLYNEYMMTGLRTMWGISLEKVFDKYGDTYYKHLIKQSKPHLENGNLILQDQSLKLSPKAKFIGDGISSDLFYL